jgi:hypothetical protein
MNVLGLSKLMNPLNTDLAKDGDELEKHITGRSMGPAVPQGTTGATVTADLESELRDLMQDYGLSDSDDDEPASSGATGGKENDPPTFDALPSAPEEPARVPHSQSQRAAAPSGGRDLGFSVDSITLGSSSGSDSDGSDDSVSDISDEAAPSSSKPPETSGGARSRDTASASAILRDLEKEWNFDLTEESFDRGRSVVLPPPMDGPSFEDHRASRRSRTEEEAERRHIEEVMGNLRDETRTTFGAQNEREQDIKANKLEQIAQLRETLSDDGITTDKVGNPSMNSPMEEIDMVLRTLRMKNDRNRCASLAEEVILGGAEMMEFVFDGSQEIPVVGWRPDYTGYSNTVNVKLHRMRYETASVVSSIIEQYSLSPLSRVLLELVPSLILYPRQQQQQRRRPGLSEDPSIMEPRVGDARSAYTSIRARDEINSDMSDRRSGRDELMGI